MSTNRRRPREIVSQPLDGIEAPDQAQQPTNSAILLPAAGSEGQAQLPGSVPADTPTATPVIEPVDPPVIEPPQFEPVQQPVLEDEPDELDQADDQDQAAPIFERVAEAVEDLAEEAEAEISDLHQRVSDIEDQVRVKEPNWYAVYAELRNPVFYPLRSEPKKRASKKDSRTELMSQAVTGINKITASQKVIVRTEALAYNSAEYVDAVNKRIHDLEHDKEGEERKLTDDEKKMKAKWLEKRDRDGHLEIGLSIILVDENQQTSKQELRTQLQRIASHFGSAYKNGQLQQLKWSECEPIDAITGRIFSVKPGPLTGKSGLFAGSDQRMVLDNQETAALFHTPDDAFRAARIRPYKSSIKQLRPKNPLPEMATLDRPTDNLIVWGYENKGRVDQRIVGNNIEQENQHVSITGRTGTGKSELLNWRFFCAACAINGDRPQAAVLLDTHGQLGIAALARIAHQIPERIPDVVLLDAGDSTHTVVWNPLAVIPNPRLSLRQQIECAVDAAMGIVQPFARFTDGGTPAAKTLARQVFWALAEANYHLENVQLSPFEAIPFLRNPEFRTAVMNLCSSESINEEFGPEGRYSTAKEDDQSKRGQVIFRAFGEMESVDAYRRMLGTGVSKLNLIELMQQNKLLIFRGSRFGTGVKLGEVLSGMIISQLLRSMEAWGRVEDELTGERRDGGAVIFGDEAPTWINYDIPIMLAESRKYNVGVELYAQYPNQYTENGRGAAMLDAVLANTASKGTLKLEVQKTGKLETSIAPEGELSAPDLASLDNFNTYQTVLLPNGSDTGPMTTACPPPFDKRLLRDEVGLSSRAEVIAASRELLSLPNDEIETILKQRQDRDALQQELLATVKRIGTQNAAVIKRLQEDDTDVVDISDDMFASSQEDWDQGQGWQKLGGGDEQ